MSSGCATRRSGHFFDVITNGYGVMYSYASRVSPEDRWAITAYIRALQLSQHAAPADADADGAETTGDREEMNELAVHRVQSLAKARASRRRSSRPCFPSSVHSSIAHSSFIPICSRGSSGSACRSARSSS